MRCLGFFPGPWRTHLLFMKCVTRTFLGISFLLQIVVSGTLLAKAALTVLWGANAMDESKRISEVLIHGL